MNKRQRKKKQFERYETYRGIGMHLGYAGDYSYLQAGDMQVMIMFPSVEQYAQCFYNAKKIIDDYWKSTYAAKYRHRKKHITSQEVPF